MPSLLTHVPCGACGTRHNFCFPAGDVVPGEEYGYVCPVTAAPAALRPADAGVMVASYPQGAVGLDPVPQAEMRFAPRPA